MATQLSDLEEITLQRQTVTHVDLTGQMNVDELPAARGNGITSLKYPIDLGENPEFGKHSVRYTIYVHDHSQIATSPNAGDSRASATGPDDRDLGVNTVMQGIKEGMDNIKGLADEADDLSNSKEWSKLYGMVDSHMGRYKKLDAFITMYMPPALSTDYAAKWSETDMKTDLNKVELLSAVISSVNNFRDKERAETREGLSEYIKKRIQRKLLDNNLANYVTQTSNNNNMAAQLFDGVQARTFTHDYVFAPRSEKEAQVALNIIRLFRYHMLPELSKADDRRYLFPSQFGIKYYTGDSENPFIEKRMTSVLTTMSVNYTPSNQFNTFEHMPGMPTQISMSLTFQELGYVSKETSPWSERGL